MWGSHFYLLCNCKAITETLEYSGEIARESRWTQELFGDHFSVIHRPAQTMMDMNRLTRRFDTLLSQYAHIVLLVSSVDRKT